QPRPDAGPAGDGLPVRARLELPGARLAADLDHAPPPARGADLGAADLPAGALGALRVGDPVRVALAAAARRRRPRPLRPADRLTRRPRSAPAGLCRPGRGTSGVAHLVVPGGWTAGPSSPEQPRSCSRLARWR